MIPRVTPPRLRVLLALTFEVVSVAEGFEVDVREQELTKKDASLSL
jgi:hypothetical protein